jgi:hypothetical protein
MPITLYHDDEGGEPLAQISPISPLLPPCQFDPCRSRCARYDASAVMFKSRTEYLSPMSDVSPHLAVTHLVTDGGWARTTETLRYAARDDSAVIQLWPS